MAKVSSPVCPGCKAPLPAARDAPVVKCEYCGREVTIARTVKVASDADADALREQIRAKVMAGAASTKKTSRVGALIIVVLIGAGAGLPLFFGLRECAKKARGRIMWVPQGDEAPVIVDIDGKGAEDFIGKMRTLKESSDTVSVVAHSGSFDRLWTAGPFGTWSEGAYMHVRVAAAGRRVVVTDVHSSGHVLDLATGKELSTFGLSDMAKRACGEPGGTRVFLHLADERNIMVDTSNGSATPVAEAPPWCAAPDHFHGCRSVTSAPCVEVKYGSVPGMSVEMAVRSGDDVVAIGVRSPGTRLPMVAGIDSAGLVRWNRPLVGPGEDIKPEGDAEMVDAHDGRAYVPYALAGGGYQGGRIQAISVANGAKVWDVVVPHKDLIFDINAMAITDERLYLPHDSFLDVLDRTTGKVLGSIGD